MACIMQELPIHDIQTFDDQLPVRRRWIKSWAFCINALFLLAVPGLLLVDMDMASSMPGTTLGFVTPLLILSCLSSFCASRAISNAKLADFGTILLLLAAFILSGLISFMLMGVAFYLIDEIIAMGM